MASALIVLGANIIGVFVCYPIEIVQREAFKETRSCIEARLKTQKENEKQASVIFSFINTIL